MIILNLEQGSPEWKEARLGVITGTKAKDVLGTKTTQENILNELISEQLVGRADEVYITQDMQRGTDEEAFAIKEYEKRTGIKIKDFGFCLHDEYDWLGLSPDGMTEDMTHAVEVKSPKSKTFVKYVRAGVIPKEYRAQVVHYFVVNEKLETLDFVIYDPRIELESLQLFVIKTSREELSREIEEAREGLLRFRELWQSEHQALTF